MLVPANAGVGSAVGLLRAPVAYEIVRGRLTRLDDFDAAAVNRLLAEMRTEAEAIVRKGAPAAELVEQRSAFMRYRGQGHEIAVELPVRTFTAADRSVVPIYWRPDLTPGAIIKGPAVIAEEETSTVVSPRFDARIDRFGYIELSRDES